MFHKELTNVTCSMKRTTLLWILAAISAAYLFGCHPALTTERDVLAVWGAPVILRDTTSRHIDRYRDGSGTEDFYINDKTGGIYAHDSY